MIVVVWHGILKGMEVSRPFSAVVRGLGSSEVAVALEVILTGTVHDVPRRYVNRAGDITASVRVLSDVGVHEERLGYAVSPWEIYLVVADDDSVIPKLLGLEIGQRVRVQSTRIRVGQDLNSTGSLVSNLALVANGVTEE